MSQPDVSGQKLTPNQAVAWNVAYYRVAAKLTQEELAARLGWSKAIISAAERSLYPGRVRAFSVDDMAAIAGVLGIPLAALLIPPPGAEVDPPIPFVAAEPPTTAGDAYRKRLEVAGTGLSEEAREAARQLRNAEAYLEKCRESLTFTLEMMLDKAREL